MLPVMRKAVSGGETAIGIFQEDEAMRSCRFIFKELSQPIKDGIKWLIGHDEFKNMIAVRFPDVLGFEFVGALADRVFETLLAAHVAAVAGADAGEENGGQTDPSP